MRQTYNKKLQVHNKKLEFMILSIINNVKNYGILNYKLIIRIMVL